MERFLNLCSSNGIIIWGSRISNGELCGKMSSKDYLKIKKYAKISKTRPRILRKKGMIYVVKRYKGRWGIAAGFVFFVVAVNLLSMFIWNINVSGNKNVSANSILASLKSSGVYEGILRRSVDVKRVSGQLLIDMPSLSWATINIDGCFATVEVKETTSKKMEQKTLYPANIVAKQGGTIMKIKAYYGVPSVSVGEAVAKGDMLVSGTMETKTGSTIYCEARAEIIAKTVHELSVFVPFEQQVLKDVDAPQKRTVINIFGLDFPLFFGKVNEPCKIERSVSVPTLNGRRLPLKITTAYITPQKRVKYVMNEKSAKEKAQKLMNEKQKKELKNMQILGKNEQFELQKNGVLLKTAFECTEDIALAKKILIN